MSLLAHFSIIFSWIQTKPIEDTVDVTITSQIVFTP